MCGGTCRQGDALRDTPPGWVESGTLRICHADALPGRVKNVKINSSLKRKCEGLSRDRSRHPPPPQLIYMI